MSLAILKKELKTMDNAALQHLILDIYSRSSTAKQYLDFYSNPDEQALLDTYSQKVIECIAPKRGTKSKIAKAKKVISEFGKLYKMPEIEAALMSAFVMNGIYYHNNVYSYHGLYQAIFTMNEKLKIFLVKHDLKEAFQDDYYRVLHEILD